MTGGGRDPHVACRARYRHLSRWCWRYGLDAAAVARSAKELSHTQNLLRVLNESAFRPTGVALGCPLPDPLVVRRLWRIARLVERRLAEFVPPGNAVFAHVPSPWYHVTLVNRTSYEDDEVVTPITREEAEQAREIVRRYSRAPIVLHIHGLILSGFGTLFAPGYPASDDLYELRCRLAEEIPALAHHVPRIAHLKLGHLLVPLAGEQLKELLSWLRACGELVNVRVTFHDAFTPWRRIDL